MSTAPSLLRSASLVLLGGAAMGAAWHSDISRRKRRTARMHRIMVQALINVLTAGDAATARHSRRVADLTDALADRFPLLRRQRSTIRVAALLHDMGKIDDRFFHIVHQARALDDEQRQSIEQHPRASAHILEPLERLHPGIINIVASHHECWTGGGYPSDLKGDLIPLGARLISVADVFDAITQPRSYHEPLAADEALEEIRKGAGRRFDPAVVERVFEPLVVNRWKEIARKGRASEARHSNDQKVISESPEIPGSNARPSRSGETVDPPADRSNSR